MGLSTHHGLVTCVRASMGFVVGVRVGFGVVVGTVLGTCISVITKLILGCAATEGPKLHIHHLGSVGHNSLLVTPAAVESSIWLELLGWSQPMAMRVWQWGIISRAVMNNAASSDSAAEAMTNLMIWAIDRIASLNQGNGSSSKR
jgi:hypothetical protein